jgi:hypothetical protein
VTTSGGKKVGAAVLARTSCHSGRRKLLSFRPVWLYFANGLLLIGQGESVLAFRITIISSVRKPGLPSVGSPPSALPSSVCSIFASGSSSYL